MPKIWGGTSLKDRKRSDFLDCCRKNSLIESSKDIREALQIGTVASSVKLCMNMYEFGTISSMHFSKFLPCWRWGWMVVRFNVGVSLAWHHCRQNWGSQILSGEVHLTACIFLTSGTKEVSLDRQKKWWLTSVESGCPTIVPLKKWSYCCCSVLYSNIPYIKNASWKLFYRDLPYTVAMHYIAWPLSLKRVL